MEQLSRWLVAFMLAKAPTNSTVELARYHEIAHDVAEVVAESKPLFDGPDGRIRTAGLLVSIMWHESGFKADVDTGRVGSRHVCLMQVSVGKRRTIEGWSAHDLLDDRTRCVQAGLRIARHSFEACRGLDQTGWLRAYVSGSCRGGSHASELRMNTARSWYDSHTPAFDDRVLMKPGSMTWHFHARPKPQTWEQKRN